MKLGQQQQGHIVVGRRVDQQRHRLPILRRQWHFLEQRGQLRLEGLAVVKVGLDFDDVVHRLARQGLDLFQVGGGERMGKV